MLITQIGIEVPKDKCIMKCIGIMIWTWIQFQLVAMPLLKIPISPMENSNSNSK